MLSPEQVDEFLDRIQCRREAIRGVDYLSRLQKEHLLHVPFENLDIHYHVPIQLDLQRLFKKIVTNKRGGFCYELNGLYHSLLSALGFETRMVSARVYDKDKGYGQEYDHLALIVTMEGIEYLADVGFGEFAFTPLRIENGVMQQDERGIFVIDSLEESLVVQKMEEGARVPQYRFTREGQPLTAFEGMCRYHQTSADSHFTRQRLISQALEGGRVTITGNRLTLKKESIQVIELQNDEEFLNALVSHFGIELNGSS
jgi:N-hydroxyarylamine O-acetyltransferase